MLEEPMAGTFHSIFHSGFIPLVCNILSASCESEQLVTFLMLSKLSLLSKYFFGLKMLLCNIPLFFYNLIMLFYDVEVLSCNIMETCTYDYQVLML